MARLMIIGESPSNTRPPGQEHIAFSGKTAHYLWSSLQDAGLPINGHFVTNVIDRLLLEGEKPNKQMVKENLPRLLTFVRQYRPDIIITVGKFATESIIGHKVKFKDVRGRLNQSEIFDNYLVFPMVHPAAAARSNKMKREIRADARQLASILRAVRFNDSQRYSLEIN